MIAVVQPALELRERRGLKRLVDAVGRDQRDPVVGAVGRAPSGTCGSRPAGRPPSRSPTGHVLRAPAATRSMHGVERRAAAARRPRGGSRTARRSRPAQHPPDLAPAALGVDPVPGVAAGDQVERAPAVIPVLEGARPRPDAVPRASAAIRSSISMPSTDSPRCISARATLPVPQPTSSTRDGPQRDELVEQRGGRRRPQAVVVLGDRAEGLGPRAIACRLRQGRG